MSFDRDIKPGCLLGIKPGVNIYHHGAANRFIFRGLAGLGPTWIIEDDTVFLCLSVDLYNGFLTLELLANVKYYYRIDTTQSTRPDELNLSGLVIISREVHNENL